VESRNPDELTALNAAPGVAHLVFIDELPSTSSTGAMSAIGQKRTSEREGLPPEPECKPALTITDRVISDARLCAC